MVYVSGQTLLAWKLRMAYAGSADEVERLHAICDAQAALEETLADLGFRKERFSKRDKNARGISAIVLAVEAACAAHSMPVPADLPAFIQVRNRISHRSLWRDPEGRPPPTPERTKYIVSIMRDLDEALVVAARQLDPREHRPSSNESWSSLIAELHGVPDQSTPFHSGCLPYMLRDHSEYVLNTDGEFHYLPQREDERARQEHSLALATQLAHFSFVRHIGAHAAAHVYYLYEFSRQLVVPITTNELETARSAHQELGAAGGSQSPWEVLRAVRWAAAEGFARRVTASLFSCSLPDLFDLLNLRGARTAIARAGCNIFLARLVSLRDTIASEAVAELMESLTQQFDERLGPVDHPRVWPQWLDVVANLELTTTGTGERRETAAAKLNPQIIMELKSLPNSGLSSVPQWFRIGSQEAMLYHRTGLVTYIRDGVRARIRIRGTRAWRLATGVQGDRLYAVETSRGWPFHGIASPEELVCRFPYTGFRVPDVYPSIIARWGRDPEH